MRKCVAILSDLLSLESYVERTGELCERSGSEAVMSEFTPMVLTPTGEVRQYF